MIPDGIKERFELYRKWFRTLLVKEFMNLPSKHQMQFIGLIKDFIENCNKVYEDQIDIKERVINLTVTKVLSPDNKQESYVICGKSSELKDEVRMSVPINRPKPKLGVKLYHTVFSLDEIVWYSSKEELITKANS